MTAPPPPPPPALTLASGSAARGALLLAAGIEADAVRPAVDEDAVKASLRAGGAGVTDQAMALAEAKAVKVSSARPGLVIGGDQMMNLDGEGLDKPQDRSAARRRLKALSGRAHRLETALVVAEDGRPVWRHLSRPQLWMRPLSPAFIEHYLDAEGEAAFETVGAYRLEGLGAQLFSRIEGDYFSILGLPLLALSGYLRERGLLKT